MGTISGGMQLNFSDTYSQNVANFSLETGTSAKWSMCLATFLSTWLLSSRWDLLKLIWGVEWAGLEHEDAGENVSIDCKMNFDSGSSVSS